MYGSKRISQGRSFAEKFYDDTTPYSPYVVIKYQYVPQDTVGEYLRSKTRVETWRGARSYSEWTQKIGTVKDAEAYRNFVEKSDRELESLTTRTSLNTLHDTYTVVVGVIDKAILHSGPGGENVISYADLFGFLAALGFDPLAPIRRSQKEYIDALGEIVRKEIVKGDFNKDSIKARIMSGLGNKMVDAVQEYIFGGRKPKLARATTEEYRPEKARKYPGLYQGAKGMNEALFETGELYEAIECNVFSSQSPMMKSYLKELRDSIRSTVKWRKKHAEKVLVEARKEEALQRGIEKYKKEMQRQSDILKRFGIEDERQFREIAEAYIEGHTKLQKDAMYKKLEEALGGRSVPRSEIKRKIEAVLNWRTGGKRLIKTSGLAPFAFFSMPKTKAEYDKYEKKILGMYKKPKSKREDKILEELIDPRRKFKNRGARTSVSIVPVAEYHDEAFVGEDEGVHKSSNKANILAEMKRGRIETLEGIVRRYDEVAGTGDAFRIREFMQQGKLVDVDIDFARFTLDVLRRNGII